MNRDKKNIILIVIDSLRANRVGLRGKNSSLTPFLDQLAQKSLSYKNVFSCGNNTEFSLPGLFSSSLLLDNGGYLYAVAKREATLAETLQKNGYRTVAFYPLYMRLRSGGYMRGFTDFFHLYDFNLVLKEMNNTVPWYQKMFAKGLMTELECTEALALYFDIYFKDLIAHCQIWLSYTGNSCIPRSAIFENYDFAAIGSEIEEEFSRYCQDKYLYVSKIVKGDTLGFDYKKGILCGGPCGLIDILNRAIVGRVKRSRLGIAEIKYRASLAWNLFWTWYLSSSFRSAKEAFALALYRVFQKQQHQIKFISAGYALQAFKNWLDLRNGTSPFYAYLHLLDVHEMNQFSFDLVGQKRKNNQELTIFKKSLSQLKRGRQTCRGNILYDTAVSYVDGVVKDLFQFLEEKNLLHSSIIVITADHGHDSPNVPIRDGVSQLDHFFDDMSHVPLIINGSDFPAGQHKDLISSIDIAPTILDLAGIPIPKSFKGISVKPGAGLQRDYVINENQGRGPCDMKRRSLRICVRTKTHKLVYECPPGNRADGGVISEMYDLVLDPAEFKNLVGDSEAIKSMEPLRRIAIERVKTIRGYLHE